MNFASMIDLASKLTDRELDELIAAATAERDSRDAEGVRSPDPRDERPTDAGTFVERLDYPDPSLDPKAATARRWAD